MSEKSIFEFLSTDYKAFALYSIEGRAIASVIDGLKPTQRKILHGCTLVWKTGTEKPLKIFQLSGKIASDCFYHHSNTSLDSAIINMAQKFKNNMALLDDIGQFGSLRSPTPGAARYIGTKLNQNFKLLYKDFELLEYKEEEGSKIEPKYFLPIVPTILINGSSGIAVGFASNILNRNPIDIIEACENVIKGKKIKEILPFNNYFKGEYIQDSNNPKRWIIRGKFNIVNTTTIKITELPPSITYEKYEAILDGLVESKLIVSYDDNCKDDINYTVKFTRESLSSLNTESIIKLLKLEESETEIFTSLNEEGKLLIFENSTDIIHYFVNFRLKYYIKRKEYLLDKMKYDLKILSNKGRFIKFILDNKLEIKNKSKDEIVNNITSLGLEKIDNSYDYLLRMPLWSLTKELFEKLKEDFTSKKVDIEKLSLVEPRDMYLTDLLELKKKIKL
jgi:DNA topoisomerase-2